MACVQPTTRSLGYVFLKYQCHAGLVKRTMRLRLTYPITPSDLSTIGPEAVLWAGYVKDTLPTNALITDWGTMNPDGSVFHVEALSPQLVGTHGAAVNGQDFRSATVTLTGKGSPVTAGQCGGPVRSVVYTGRAFYFAPAQIIIAGGFDSTLDDLRDFITGNSVLGADFYGNVGNYKGFYQVQMNAHAQRRLGT